MSELRILRTAVWRELYSRRRAFAVSTGLLLALVVGGMVAVAATIDEDAVPTLSVGVLDAPVAELETELRRTTGPDAVVRVVPVATRAGGEEALRNGELSALVVGPREALWAGGTPSWAVDSVASAMRAVAIRNVASDLGITGSELAELLAPVVGQTIDYEERDEGIAVVASVSVILMFLAIIAYGQWIAYGVVEEKANRVAELVLGAVTPTQLLVTKVVTLGGLGLLQLGIVGSVAVFTGSTLADISLPPVAGSTLAWLVVWFVAGFAFYGTLYAAAGSLAADTQEAGNAIGPLNILPGVAYMVGLIAFPAGNAALPRILSFIPIWTPLLMPGRMARDEVAPWELAVTIVVMLVSIVLMVRVASRVYLGGITQATRSVGWRQAFRGGRDYGSGAGPSPARRRNDRAGGRPDA